MLLTVASLLTLKEPFKYNVQFALIDASVKLNVKDGVVLVVVNVVFASVTAGPVRSTLMLMNTLSFLLLAVSLANIVTV